MVTGKEILNVLAASKNPLKAKEIASSLSRAKGEQVTRREVNSLLYRMKSRGEVLQEESFCWRVEEQKGEGTGRFGNKPPRV